jgi:hypothetical protein
MIVEGSLRLDEHPIFSQIIYLKILKAKSKEIDSMTNSEPSLTISLTMTTHC